MDAFLELLRLSSVPLIPNSGASALVLLWMVVAVYSLWKGTNAYQEALIDRRLAHRRRAANQIAASALETAVGEERMVRGVYIVIICLALLGVLVVFSPQPVQASVVPNPSQRTLAQLFFAPVMILAHLALAWTARTMVHSRDRWRVLWRQEHSRGGAAR